MRRILLVLVVVSASGLFTARAADFSPPDVNLESFTTSVSVSVPETTTTTCPEVPIPSPLWLRSVSLPPVTPILDVTTPGSTEGLTSPRGLQYSSGSVQSVTSNTRYEAWRTLAPPPACGYRIRGDVTVHLRTNYSYIVLIGGLPHLKARLFTCSTAPTPPPPNLSDTSLCTPLGTADGFEEIQRATLAMTQVDLGYIDALVPAGRDLRLKVTADSRGFSLITNPSIQWGYSSTNALNNARVTVTPVAP